MIPPLTTPVSIMDVKVRRFYMSPPLRKKHGAVDLTEYQVAVEMSQPVPGPE